MGGNPIRERRCQQYDIGVTGRIFGFVNKCHTERCGLGMQNNEVPGMAHLRMCACLLEPARALMALRSIAAL